MVKGPTSCCSAAMKLLRRLELVPPARAGVHESIGPSGQPPRWLRCRVDEEVASVEHLARPSVALRTGHSLARWPHVFEEAPGGIEDGEHVGRPSPPMRGLTTLPDDADEACVCRCRRCCTCSCVRVLRAVLQRSAPAEPENGDRDDRGGGGGNHGRVDQTEDDCDERHCDEVVMPRPRSHLVQATQCGPGSLDSSGARQRSAAASAVRRLRPRVSCSPTPGG
jgi:hypothetical protein